MSDRIYLFPCGCRHGRGIGGIIRKRGDDGLGIYCAEHETRCRSIEIKCEICGKVECYPISSKGGGGKRKSCEACIEEYKKISRKCAIEKFRIKKKIERKHGYKNKTGKRKKRKTCACCGWRQVPPHNHMLCDNCYKTSGERSDIHDAQMGEYILDSGNAIP